MLSLFSQFIFGNSGLFSGKDGSSSSPSWKDRSLCFDMRQSDLELNLGEQLIASFFPIEDIKGNQDEAGLLMVTNLRLIWICCNKRRVNLSIGWRTVLLTFQQNHKDSLGMPVTSLCVLTKYDSTKYEFVFNKLSIFSEIWNGQDNYQALIQLRRYRNDKSLAISHLSPLYMDEPFEVVFQVWQCYKRTQLFRQCRANLTNLLPVTTDAAEQAGINVGEINKLPGEEIVEVYTRVVQAETRTIKYTGTLMLSNIRLIWIDESLPMRNLSVPYIRIDYIKLKHNDKIVIGTYDYLATSNHIELRLPKESQAKKTKIMFEQIQNLCSLYKARPRYGPESCDECIDFMSNLKPIEHYFENLNESTLSETENFGTPYNRMYLVDSDQNRIDPKRLDRKAAGNELDAENGSDANDRELSRYRQKLSSYMDEQPIERDQELVYSRDLGLTIERPVNDKDLGSIWQIDL